MNELIQVDFESQMMSARELHERLNIKTRFGVWFPRMCEYGFIEQVDFVRVAQKCDTLGGEQTMVDYQINMDMAKQICMIQRTPEGKAIRQYLIDLEKAWNTPELVMARGLRASQLLLEKQGEIIKQLTADTERMKPKEIFADAVATSHTSILIGELAKLLKQNGVDIGQNRLFKWLREHKYLMKGNEPTQKSMNLGLFEVLERTCSNPDGSVRITRTTKVTGKGQQYFINKFLGKEKAS